ncbi:ABC transporter substrate-binding protein [Parasphaerochaeta coccoides]|uniref:ABC transporter substrate binding protein n=1 Tax=Parasphaerochaeta coccoides (strain ATCC BAA-1237 / DSM 17374 / SPN1) TaxID=760011 RepID=F4GJE9_PARC1|nr:ABC transporter substrate-binding protein [Parasphaerochaeta coccoides]AEC02214.1 ABC transporter substrate binding protein [Parasphaerochaeta coccoides DSM 17374]
MTIRRTALIIVLSLISFSLAATGAKESSPSRNISVTTIGISQLVSHPALDSIAQGIEDYLAEKKLPVEVELQNASGEISTAAAIARKFKMDGKDIVVGIATPTAQALANAITTSPVVFSAVTEPISAGLVSSYAPEPGSNVTGVSDLTPVAEQIALFIRVTGARKLGMVYTSGEANGVVQMEMAKEAAQKAGVEFISASVSNSAEVKMATQSIIERVDALYIAIDNTVVSAIASVSDVAKKAGKPLFNADTTSSEGIDFLMSWGFDYYNFGTATGQVIERLINGEKPSDIGTVFLDDPTLFELWINMDVAQELGVVFPADILQAAKVVFQAGEKHIK